MRRPLTYFAGAAALATSLTACGSGGGSNASECAPVASSITVGALDKLTFDATAYSATPGCIQVTYRNEGNIAHTLRIKDEKDFRLAVGNVDSGKVALTAGTYRLYCDIPGHENAGMHAELTVG